MKEHRREKFKNPSKFVQLDSTNLPIVFIETGDRTQKINREGYVPVRIRVVDNGNGVLNYCDTAKQPNQHMDYDGTAKLRLRGGGSLKLDKKSFAIRLTDESGKEEKHKLLGMKKSKRWCLLAVHRDGSMIRDVLTYELARPYFDFVPKAKHCEVIIDGVYQGVYLLSEDVSRGRLGISKQDGTGNSRINGYFLEKNDGITFRSRYPSRDWQGMNISEEGVSIEVKYPKSDHLSAEQLSVIENEFGQMEDAIESVDFAEYSKYIDVQSFVNFLLVQEFANNVDGYNRSVKLYKRDADDKFRLTIWDFDVAYGNWMEFEGRYADVWHYADQSEFAQYGQKAVFWWQKLMQDTVFTNQVRNQWKSFRESSYTDEHIISIIDSLSYVLIRNHAIDRNCEAWSTWKTRRQNAWPGKCYIDEIGYLKAWIAARLEFMDSQILGINTDNDIKTKSVNQIGSIMILKDAP